MNKKTKAAIARWLKLKTHKVGTLDRCGAVRLYKVEEKKGDGFIEMICFNLASLIEKPARKVKTKTKG
jgi:hypothetical protein